MVATIASSCGVHANSTTSAGAADHSGPMRAAVLRSGSIVTDELPDPIPGEGQVLVRSLACGICGSDLHAAAHYEEAIALQQRIAPGGGGLVADRDLVMGHEYCAEIVDFGPGTSRSLAVGSRVTSMPVGFVGGAVQTVGYSHERPGGFGELMVLDEALLLPVPDHLPTELAALTEPLAVGRHAVEAAQLTGDELPLVIGCGPIGLAVIAELRRRGLGPVLAADLSPARRALAEQLGADEVLDPSAGSPYGRWQDFAWPEGADRQNPLVAMLGQGPRPGVVFECVGRPGMIAAAMDGAMRGNQLVVVGVCMQEDRFEPLVAIGKQLTVRFVLAYTPQGFADTLRALGAGELAGVEAMLTDRVGVDGVAGAFTELADPEQQAKVLVEPWR